MGPSKLDGALERSPILGGESNIGKFGEPSCADQPGFRRFLRLQRLPHPLKVGRQGQAFSEPEKLVNHFYESLGQSGHDSRNATRQRGEKRRDPWAGSRSAI